MRAFEKRADRGALGDPFRSDIFSEMRAPANDRAPHKLSGPTKLAAADSMQQTLACVKYGQTHCESQVAESFVVRGFDHGNWVKRHLTKLRHFSIVHGRCFVLA